MSSMQANHGNPVQNAKRENVSVLIVGAGPTGLVAANLLGLYGIEVLLIERNEHLCQFPRAISIDDEGLRICQACGLSREILQHVLLDVAVRYLSRGRCLLKVRPHSRRNGYPLLSTFDQPGLEAALLQGIKRYTTVKVCFGHTLTKIVANKNNVIACITTASGEEKEIHCDYLLACDGGKSTVRHLLSIPLHGTRFTQRWLVMDGYYKESHEPHSEPIITFICDPDRPMVNVPAPHNQQRWELMLQPFENAHQLLFSNTINRILQSYTKDTFIVERHAVYSFQASCIARLTHNRIFLLGDAAHMFLPFAGQGMNSGLRDACNLSWKLAFVLRTQAHVSILASYQQERHPHIRQTRTFSLFLSLIVMPKNRIIATFRDHILYLLTKHPVISKYFQEMQIKPSSNYSHGLIFFTGSSLSRKLTGQLLPQPIILNSDQQCRLLDDLFGPHLTLLRLYHQPNDAFLSLQEKIWQANFIQKICIVPFQEKGNFQGIPGKEVPYVIDIERGLAEFLHYRRDLYVLVRPDRYILAVFRIAKEKQVVAYLRQYFDDVEGVGS